MAIGFVLTVYKRPELVARVLDALDGRPVALHVDRKSPERASLEALGRARSSLILESRVCHWGLYGLMDATLSGLARLLAETDCDHVCVLSGQCYPLKPIGQIEAELSALGDASIIESHGFPHPGWARWERGGFDRIETFNMFWRRRRRFKLWKRRLPRGLTPSGGSGYFALSRRHAQYVVSLMADRPDIKRFFATTYIPDEVLVQTLLASSPDPLSLVNRSTHHIVWKEGSWHPDPLTPSDLDGAFASGREFARKIDHLTVADAIDDRLRRA